MPDNEIGWGQGATNNDIEWGKAYTNNTIGFGAVYPNSPSGDTDLIGGSSVEEHMKFEVTVPSSDLSMQFSIDGRTFTGGAGYAWGYTIDWGDGTTFTQPYSASYSKTHTHTYSSASSYTITIDWQNAFNNTNAYYSIIMNSLHNYKLTKWLSWGIHFKIGSYKSMFSGLRNMVNYSNDFPTVWNVNGPLASHNWLATFGNCESYNSPINLSDYNVSLWTSSSRYSNTFQNMYNLPQLTLQNETINNGASQNPWVDAGFTQNVGRDTSSGCLFQFSDINVEGAGANNLFGQRLAQQAYLHKESYFKNFTYDTSSMTTHASFSSFFGACYIKNVSDNEDLTIDFTGWKTTNNTILPINPYQFASQGFRKDGATTTSGTLTIDMTSPYGLEFHYTARNMFYDIYNTSKWSGLTIIGAGNWTINNITNSNGLRNMFYNCGTLDIDLTNFDFTGVSQLNSFLNGNTVLTTSRYEEALLAWDASGVQNIVNLKMAGSQYTAGSAAETAKNNLINNKGWSINDGGAV